MTSIPVGGDCRRSENNVASGSNDPSSSVVAMTPEHLALIDFASRLGAATTNNDIDAVGVEGGDNGAGGGSGTDAKDGSSVRDEAMLLMSLLMGKKASDIFSERNPHGPGTGNVHGASIAEGSPQQERRREDREDEGGARASSPMADVGNFVLRFPSLSLREENWRPRVSFDDPQDPGRQDENGSGDGDGNRCNDSQEGNEEDPPPPSQLLGRTRTMQGASDVVSRSSDAMARNILESFGAALVWRAKTWIQCLARVLALKEKKHCLERGDEKYDHQDDDDENSVDCETNGSRHNLSPSIEHEIVNSREIQIIEAIVRSSEEVSVVNVETSFRVVPGESVVSEDVLRQFGLASEPQKPVTLPKKPSPPKKRKVFEENATHKVAHSIVFEAIVSMTCYDSNGYGSVKITAPGILQGEFLPDAGNGGGVGARNLLLSGASIALDTEALAMSLEQQSRVVVRKSAEDALVAAGGNREVAERSRNVRSPPTPQSPHRNHSVISPKYVMMSPLQPNRGYPYYDHKRMGFGSDEGGGGDRSNRHTSVPTFGGAPAAANEINLLPQPPSMQLLPPQHPSLQLASAARGGSGSSTVVSSTQTDGSSGYETSSSVSLSSHRSKSPSNLPALLEVASAALNRQQAAVRCDRI